MRNSYGISYIKDSGIQTVQLQASSDQELNALILEKTGYDVNKGGDYNKVSIFSLGQGGGLVLDSYSL